jgi:hypothetical protein
MPNRPPSDPRKDGRGLLWIDWEDFTAGIYQWEPSTASPPTHAHPAPFGSCTDNTVNCLPIPSGGIAPGPGYVAGKTLTTTGFSLVHHYISSFFCNPQSGGIGYPEFIFTLEGDNSAGTNYLQNLYAYSAGVQHALTNGQLTYTGEGGLGIVPAGSLTFSTRMTNTNPTTTAGLPTIVGCLAAPTEALTGSSQPVWAYPDPTAVTANQVFNLNSAVINLPTGFVVGYSGRVLVFAQEADAWPASATFIVNEKICYTDPTNSIDLGDQNIIVVPENPYGYAAAGSISDGELFLVKQTGGGVVITGDMNNPNATYLPGVQPGGNVVTNAVGQGASSANGFYYCSSNDGAWVWNGGNVSTKVSPQLYDNFFTSTTFPFASLYFSAYKFGHYILFSNNWIYDEQTGGWWQFQGLNINPYFFYGTGTTSDSFWACVPSQGTGSGHAGYNSIADEYSRSSPAYDYVWQSQPFKLSTDMHVDIREIVIRALGPPASIGNCSISINITTETGTSTTFNTISSMQANAAGGPTEYRVTGSVKALSAQLEVVVLNSTPAAAPTIYSISLGYRSREKSTNLQ